MQQHTLESGKALTLFQYIFPEECVDIEENSRFNWFNVNQRLSCRKIILENCCSHDCIFHNTTTGLKLSRHHIAWPDRRRQHDHGNDSERSCGPIEISRIHTVSPLEIPPVILPETAGWASMASDAKQVDKPMNNPKQKYTIYRDNDLIASDLLSLPSIVKFVRNDALKEHSQGDRPSI